MMILDVLSYSLMVAVVVWLIIFIFLVRCPQD